MKVYIPPVDSIRMVGPRYDFVFSDDLEKWIHSPKVKHAARQKEYDRNRPKRLR